MIFLIPFYNKLIINSFVSIFLIHQLVDFPRLAIRHRRYDDPGKQHRVFPQKTGRDWVERI